MKQGHEVSPPEGIERFPLIAVRERWLVLSALEHEILPFPADFAREGEDLVVRRFVPPGRRIAAGRIPAAHASELFLQAASAISFFQAHGLWLDEEDVGDAVWDLHKGVARLWLTHSPASARREGPGPAPSAVLAAFLHRLFARGRRIAGAAARTLFDRLLSSDAAYRRAEFWCASAYRLFPDLATPASAAARARTLGFAGGFLRPAERRALVEKARALLGGKVPRIFSPGPPLTAGGALDLPECPSRSADASRALRARHEAEAGGGRALWIAVTPSLWDGLSRRAFETARHALEDRVEVLEIRSSLPPPLLPDEWRREVFVPCGALRSSLRFYEAFAGLVRDDPGEARRLAVEIVSSAGWAAFAGDATGDAPFPFVSGKPAAAAPPLSPAERNLLDALLLADKPAGVDELALVFPRGSVSRRLAALTARDLVEEDAGRRWTLTARGRAACAPDGALRKDLARTWARVETDPGRRISLLLTAGENEAALEEGRHWFQSLPEGSAERWFDVSSRLAQAAGEKAPAWLDLLEAEREIASGRTEEAEARLGRIEAAEAATLEERRIAMLRWAEVRMFRGDFSGARRMAAAFRRAFPEAPPRESARALKLEATCRAREGEHEPAFALLDEAESLGAGLPLSEQVDIALARADVHSLAGHLREEQETYDAWRPKLERQEDDGLTARFLGHEALGLADRRDFAAAVARLEEARAALQDDPVERAKVTMNLAAVLYHAGRAAPSEALLEEAIALASMAGRDDLARTARGDRLELLTNRGEWGTAEREVQALASEARASGDDLRLLVALHHESRLALRRGQLARASGSNAEARALAERLSDRLEVGELWLEEGDRLAFLGNFEGARQAWEIAAADPPDRCDSDRLARLRLRELAWREEGGLPPPAVDSLAELFARDEYAAAETAARWVSLLGEKVPAALRARAEEVLRSRGGEALADIVFGRRGPAALSLASGVLRSLRDAVARALVGDEADPPFSALGLSGLVLSDGEGREVLRLGRTGGEDGPARLLAAGSASYRLRLFPEPAEEDGSAIALVLETLLFRLLPAAAPSEQSDGWRRVGIVAADTAMEEPYRRLCRFARQPVTALVLGESGTGKEAVARAVHTLSARAAGPFVAVNVPAIPAALLESELFGHVRGAFTGADRDRRGLLEEAEGGTVFFDEIGDLTPPLQAKILRVLQEREIRRVGETRTRRVDVRIVSATSRDLEKEVEAGRFREDLFYRLHVAVITLPPLRERGRDALLIARHFLERYAREYGRGTLSFAPEALSAIGSHTWPGNVRELQNAVAQAAALADENGVVTALHLPPSLRREGRATSVPQGYRSRVDAHRRDLISEALERAGGNRSRAARDLGLSRQALLYLIRELHIPARSRAGH